MQTENLAAPPEQAPPPAPPVEPAPVEEKKPEIPENYVDQKLLHQERATRRRLERDLAEERLKWETANRRLEEIAKKFQPQEKVPDANEDPVGGIIHETKQTREEIAALRKEREEEKRQSAVERQRHELMQRFDQSARTFASKQPDFVKAQEHLFRDYLEEAQEAGATEDEAQREAWEKWGRVVNRAFENGENPAEKIFNLSKRRGYKASSDTQDKVETIANGSKATSPLSSAAGKAPSRLSAEVIANMSQEDFDKLSEADFRRVFGG